MQALFLVLHVLVGIGLITLILLQHGKGADAGAAFGSGASATVFGARGSATFLTKATAVLALLFFQQLLPELSVRQYDGAEEHHRRREGGQLAHGDHREHHRPDRRKVRAAGRAAAVRSPCPPRRIGSGCYGKRCAARGVTVAGITGV